MCVIREFHIVHPDGFREPKRKIHYCQWGRPCNNTIVEVTEDRYLEPQTPVAHDPYYQEVQPRNSHRGGDRKAKKLSDGLKLVFDFHIPFTSKKRKGRKPKYVYVRRRGSRRGPESPRRDEPPMPPRQYPPDPVEPGMPYPPYQPPPHSQPHDAMPGAYAIHPEQLHHPNDAAYPQASFSTPSPDNPVRVHRRQTEAEIREYEERKRRIADRERRNARRLAEEAARLRAERDAEEAARIRAERDAERERARRHDAEDERRRIRHEARRRLESEERLRRRQDQEEWERQQARLRQEQEDRERIRAGYIRREYEERARIDRLQHRHIPRNPRHRNTLHQWPRRTLEEPRYRGDRGAQVINEAIRSRQRREFDQAPETAWPRRRGVGGGRRRRERRVYDDDWRRDDGRFI